MAKRTRGLSAAAASVSGGGGSGSPGLPEYSVQFNQPIGSFAGNQNLTFLAASAQLTIGSVAAGGLPGILAIETGAAGYQFRLTVSQLTASWDWQVPPQPVGVNYFLIDTSGTGLSNWISPAAATTIIEPSMSAALVADAGFVSGLEPPMATALAADPSFASNINSQISPITVNGIIAGLFAAGVWNAFISWANSVGAPGFSGAYSVNTNISGTLGGNITTLNGLVTNVTEAT